MENLNYFINFTNRMKTEKCDFHCDVICEFKDYKLTMKPFYEAIHFSKYSNHSDKWKLCYDLMKEICNNSDLKNYGVRVIISHIEVENGIVLRFWKGKFFRETPFHKIGIFNLYLMNVDKFYLYISIDKNYSTHLEYISEEPLFVTSKIEDEIGVNYFIELFECKYPFNSKYDSIICYKYERKN